jgi:hypothetical protein
MPEGYERESVERAEKLISSYKNATQLPKLSNLTKRINMIEHSIHKEAR